MALPGDELGWRDLSRAGMAPCWRQMAQGSGGSVWEREDVLAAIVPKAPTRSVFNSVFYEDGERLLACLDEIAAAYEVAGIEAWTVWVPEADTSTAAGLERAGHLLDAVPRYMGMALDELREPPPAAPFEIREAEDYAEMARLNEIAYGYPPGDFAPVAEAPMRNIRIWFADREGEPVCTLATWPYRGDAVVIWVATLPEARGQGIARALLAHALREARADGLVTTTLQSTKLGAPVYTRLGYRDFGAGQMWERRSSG